MTRRPSMQHYCADFAAETRLMTRAAVGAHVTMRDSSWEHGPIPDSTDALFRAMGLGREDSFDLIWSEVKPKWSLGEQGWFHPRTEQTRIERDAFVAKQQANGRRGGRPARNPGAIPNQTQHEPMGSVNKNPNSNPNESSPPPTSFSDLRSLDPLPPADSSPRDKRATKRDRKTHSHARAIDTRACQRGICISAWHRGQLEGRSGKGPAAPAFVDRFVEAVLADIGEDATITEDSLKFVDNAWLRYCRSTAPPAKPHDDWFEECKRPGSACGGRCESEYQHGLFSARVASA